MWLPKGMALTSTQEITEPWSFLHGASAKSPQTTSHNYVDIWRSINGGSYKSLAQEYGGSNADGLLEWHQDDSISSSNYEKEKWPMVLDDPRQPAGTVIRYKVYVGLWNGGTVTIGGSNGNGQYPEHFVYREVVGEATPGVNMLPASAMPPGATVQYVSNWQNVQNNIQIPDYNNQIQNFRPTSMEISITTKRDNSHLMIQGQLTTSRGAGSHDYVDIWRSVNGGEYVSLAQEMSGTDADGLLSLHSNSGGRGYSKPKRPWVLDKPNRPLGTVLSYKVYLGMWSGSFVTMGGMTDNQNGNPAEHFVVREIAVAPTE